MDLQSSEWCHHQVENSDKVFEIGSGDGIRTHTTEYLNLLTLPLVYSTIENH